MPSVSWRSQGGGSKSWRTLNPWNEPRPEAAQLKTRSSPLPAGFYQIESKRKFDEIPRLSLQHWSPTHKPRLIANYRPTRSKIIRARFTLSETTAVRRGEGWLISVSRARRTAAMIAAAMTSVDFIRVCSCICSAQASRSSRNCSLHFTHQSTTERTRLGPSLYERLPRKISDGR